MGPPRHMTIDSPTARKRLGQVRRSLRVERPDAGQCLRALKLTAPVVVGLLLAAAVFGPTVAAMGLIGAMGAGVARDAPLRRRLITMGVVGALTLGNAAIGMAIGNHVWLVPPVITAATWLGVWAWQALRTGPPGPINMLFALVYGQHVVSMGYSPAVILPVLAVAWAGAAVGTLLIFALDVEAPVRDAVDQAEQAVSAYRDRPDDLPASEVDGLRHAAHVGVESAWAAVFDAKLPIVPVDRHLHDLRERLVGVHLNLLEELHAERFPASPLDVQDAIDTVPQGRPPRRYLLRTALSRGARPMLVALRAAIAVLLASSTVIVSPIGRPYWAVLSALIVLHMGASRTDLTLRGLHRVLGTVAGVLLYFVVVQTHPTPWLGLLVVGVAIYLMNLFIARNYALGVVFVTTYALLMLPVASQQDAVVFMRERVAETVIGVLASLVSIWFVGRRAPVLLVRGQFRRTLRAIELVLRDQAVGDSLGDDALEHRRDLLFELARAAETLTSQRKDHSGLDRWQSPARLIARFGYDVLARSWRQLDGPDPSADTAARSLDWVVSSLPPLSSVDIDAKDLGLQVSGIHHDYMRRTAPAATD